jgi:hypothetical protein
VVAKLLSIAVETAKVSKAEVHTSFQEPNWEATQGWHWEIYVPAEVQVLWRHATKESRLLAFILAESRASLAGSSE